MQPDTYTLDLSTLRRYRVWALWVVVSLTTAVFAILCFVSSGIIENKLDYGGVTSSSILRPVVVASIFTGVVIMFFIFVSFTITAKRSIADDSPSKLNAVYAVSLFHMSLLTLLCAATMHGFSDYLSHVKDGTYEYSVMQYHVYVSTFAMGYVCAVVYLFYSLSVWRPVALFVETPQHETPSIEPTTAARPPDVSPSAPLIEELSEQCTYDPRKKTSLFNSEYL